MALTKLLVIGIVVVLASSSILYFMNYSVVNESSSSAEVTRKHIKLSTVDDAVKAVVNSVGYGVNASMVENE